MKVLDACSFNDRFWVFASGLTNVEVRITVTDTETGRIRQYFNPEGKAFAPVQDVSAFATCPYSAFRECPDLKRRGALAVVSSTP